MWNSVNITDQKWLDGWAGIAALAFLAMGIGFVIRFLLKKNRCGRHVADRSDSLKILNTRLARGEISDEEYKLLKKAL
ncbi:SHOCT domain-containing protein [Fundidesulfovibrio putealis]|uniref:SHOCT domain-containing protein n=1 Tax=Fundidesulfovibrio putealis TaxID=270496 RepID=UPI0005B930AC|nr:SHOCT domain-containing protein [Fundidesulfovibrio putealis]